jgi:hypothetical protein
MSAGGIEAGAANLVRSYPEDLEETLCSEHIQFTDLMKTDTLPSNPDSNVMFMSPTMAMSSELKTILLIKHHHIEQTLLNAESVLRIYLSVMVSNCISIPLYSKLKPIKNETRNRIGEERLSNM